MYNIRTSKTLDILIHYFRKIEVKKIWKRVLTIHLEGIIL